MYRPSTLTRTELRLFFRDPNLYAWTLGLPVVLLAIMGTVPAWREVTPELDNQRVIDLYVPIIIAMTFAGICLFATPTLLATARDKGVLRRMRTTPVRPRNLLASQVAVQAVLAVTVVVILLFGGALAYDTPLPEQAVGFLLALALTAAALFAIGLFVAAVAPSAGVASGVGTVAFFPLMFFAGLWAPREAMPDALVRIGDLTPLGAAVSALQDSMTGDWPSWVALVTLAAYAAVAGYGAARFFRWE